ncbi:MAG: hypothetical protein KUG64_11150 [Cycloclasticus sp.]|nr:hypothetical protein [Cycloclasticus sp.]
MDVYQMKVAIDEAKKVQSNADQMAKEMAKMLVGRLRKIAGPTSIWWDHDILAKLKKELSEYNVRTKQWKS